MKTFHMARGEVTIRARTKTEAQEKFEELVGKGSRHVKTQPKISRHRGYTAVVWPTFPEGFGSYIVDPSGRERAFAFSATEKIEKEVEKVHEHMVAMALDELGPLPS